MSERAAGQNGRRHLRLVQSGNQPGLNDAPPAVPPPFSPAHARATRFERILMARMWQDQLEQGVIGGFARHTETGIELPDQPLNDPWFSMRQPKVSALYEKMPEREVVLVRIAGMLHSNYRSVVSLELDIKSGDPCHTTARERFRRNMTEADTWMPAQEAPERRISVSKGQLLVAHAILVQVTQPDSPNETAIPMTPGEYIAGGVALGLPLGFD